MRKMIMTAALLASAAAATPAMAQDAAPFTGPRAEVIVGWDHVSDDTLNNSSRDGVTYGGAIGYDFQSGGTVFGVEGEVTGATTRDTAENVLVAGDSLRVKAGRDLYAGARVGFVVGDRALVYAKGGYTNARFDARYTSGATTVRDHDTADGWRLGAGTEVKLTNKVYGKAEYRFSKYDSIDVERHQVVAGLGVRF